MDREALAGSLNLTLKSDAKRPTTSGTCPNMEIHTYMRLIETGFSQRRRFWRAPGAGL